MEDDAANVNALMSGSGATSTAVGPVLYLELEIEGVPVKAVVDSGAQSTVISRDLLYEINRHMREQGRPSPTLELPSATLYGKGGRDSSRLCITAQTDLQLSVDGLTVTAPIFIQPSSVVPCLPARYECSAASRCESCESQWTATGRAIIGQRNSCVFSSLHYSFYLCAQPQSHFY